MFRFNPKAWTAWGEAVASHKRGDGEPLGVMIRSGDPMPDDAREYVAATVERAATRPKGRPKKQLDADAIYRVRAIYGHFHALRNLRNAGEARKTYDEAKRATAREFNVSETEVARIVRLPDDDAEPVESEK